MKSGVLRFSLCVSMAAHVLLAGVVLIGLRGRQDLRLPDGETVLALTLVAAPKEAASEPERDVTPTVQAPVMSASVPEPPTPVVEPAEPQVVPAPEPSPERLLPVMPVATAAIPQATTHPLTGVEPSSVVHQQNEARGDHSSVDPGEDQTTALTTAGVRARPAYKRNPEPVYPASARRRGQQGTVLLSVRVTAEGRAAQVRIKTSSGFGVLDEAAAKAVREWEFEPARLNSVSVVSEIEVSVRFKLAE